MDDLFTQHDFTRTIRDFDYTRKAGRNLQKLYESENFDDCDSQEIFDYLYRQMDIVSFGDYLKRYIYERAGIEQPFREVPDKEYIEIIVDSFRESQTPVSTTPTTRKMSAAARSWLSAGTVRRESVFLLGFGLRMTLGDVSEFLTKVIRERDFDLESPVEAIYFYCFWNEKKYLEAKELIDRYEALTEQQCLTDEFSDEAVSGMIDEVQQRRALIGDRSYLEEYLRALKAQYFRGVRSLEQKKTGKDGKTEVSGASGAGLSGAKPGSGAGAGLSGARAGSGTGAGLSGARAGSGTGAGLSGAGAGSGTGRCPAGARTAGQLLADEEFRRLYHDSCARAYTILRDSYEDWKRGGKTEEDVSSSDLEKMLCSGIPTTRSGNLEKSSAGSLGKAFGNYRMSRQRLDSLLKGTIEVERTDLITLNFFLYATDDTIQDPVIRFEHFRTDMNKVLNKCRMYELYVVNPYETFILMCTLTEYPLASYNDIWEYSYESRE